MLGSNRGGIADGRTYKLLVTVVGSLMILALSVFTPSFAQTAADLSATRNWLESKSRDPTMRPLLGKESGDACASGKGIAFDPVACIEGLLSKWLGIQRIAAADQHSPPAVKNTIRLVVEGLRDTENEWKSLSEAAKRQQIASREEILAQFESSGADSKRTLQSITSNSRTSQQTRDIAPRIFGGAGGSHGGPFCFMTCYCVWAVGCPCCASQMPSDIKIDR